MIRHALDRAGDATMRYVARELGWARLGAGGKDGAEPGAVAWAAFRHHNARPTQHIQDGKTGVTYLADIPVPGDPHEHTHYALFNAVVTDSGRVGSLDTKRLHSRVHEFGANFQALLGEELRSLGTSTQYHKQEQAVILSAIPEKAVDQFSKSRRQVLGFGKRFAADQGLDWDTMSMDGKFGILAFSGLAAQVTKSDATNEHELWRAEARALGWERTTVLENVKVPVLTDAERFDHAYRYAARHLAETFKTAAVIDHDLLRTFAVRGLIGVGIAGGHQDIDRLVELIEHTVADEPFFHRVASGKIKLSANTVVVIDEVSQVAPRSFLKLLELQAEHGFTVKALGDREQCQAIEAGDTIEILRRVLPKVAMPELLTTVRQETARAREIAGLFRDGRTAEAFDMKRQDGTAWRIGGDQDQVIDRIADLYMQRRDVTIPHYGGHGLRPTPPRRP